MPFPPKHLSLIVLKISSKLIHRINKKEVVKVTNKAIPKISSKAVHKLNIKVLRISSKLRAKISNNKWSSISPRIMLSSLLFNNNRNKHLLRTRAYQGYPIPLFKIISALLTTKTSKIKSARVIIAFSWIYTNGWIPIDKSKGSCKNQPV